MQRTCQELRGPADCPVLTPHELDQEWLYRVWADGRLSGAYIVMWARQIEVLQREAPCDYLIWLLQRSPALEKNGTGQRPVRRARRPRAGEALARGS